MPESKYNTVRELEDILFSLHLSILNRPRDELDYVPLGTSMVDLTLCGDEIDITDWSFLDYDSLSDHPFIFFKTKTVTDGQKGNRQPFKPVPRLKDIDTSLFLSLLKTKTNQLYDPSLDINSKAKIDREITKLTDCMADCARKCKVNKPKAKSPVGHDWWSADLESLRQKLRHCLKTSHTNPNVINVANYKPAKAAYQRAIRRSKNESFQNFYSNNMNRDLFGGIKRFSGCHGAPSIPNKLVANGQTITEGSKIINLLADSFFPKEKALSASHKSVVSSLYGALSPTNGEVPAITPEEVNSAISDSKSNSSPGIDGLAADMIKFCHQIIGPWLGKIYNSCFALYYFPDAWKMAKICVLRKAGKDSYNDVKSFRPISLLNVLGKCLEKIIHSRLVWLSNVGGWISDAQHGFVENKSTESAAHDLVSLIESNFNKKVFAGVGFLDISSAFDATWPPSILNALYKKLCPTYIVRIIKSFLEGRSGIILDGNKMHHQKIHIGCPQGSVLSPFLWSILIDHILRSTFPFPYKLIAYADDIAIISWDRDTKKSVANLQLMCNSIVKLFKEILLDINAQKTTMIIFTRSRSSLPCLALTIHNIEITPSNSIKFLGLEIDHKLNWRKHIDNKCTTTKTLIHGIRRYLSLTWGLDTLKLIKLYDTTVIPAFLYGCSVWAGALKSKALTKKLRSIQRTFLRYITRSFKSVSTAALITLSNSLPIDLKVLEITCNRYFMYKPTFAPSSKLAINWVLGKVGPIPDVERPRRFLSPSHPPWSTTKNFILHPFQRNVNIPSTTPCSAAVVFADASKIKSDIGFSSICSTSEGIAWTHQEKLPDHTSIFRAESIAINQSIRLVRERILSKDISCILLFSDSQAALTASASNAKSCSISADTHRLLLESPRPIHLYWSPGHAGNEGNERADTLAKEAAANQTIPTRTVPHEKKTLLSAVKIILQEKWEEEWQSSDQDRQTKMFFPSASDAKVLQNSFIHHELTQILTGHSALNGHLHKIGIASSPSCAAAAWREKQSNISYSTVPCSPTKERLFPPPHPAWAYLFLRLSAPSQNTRSCGNL